MVKCVINKTTMGRITAWMADQEDSSLLEESVELAQGQTIEDYLLDEAMDIFAILETKCGER